MADTTLIGAVNLALMRAMEEDERVLVLGEDVGVNGGVFRATEGLHERFGAERVIDTPLAELAIGGVAVGMAAAGLRPVAEIQFMGFIYPTIDQMLSHASRLRNRTRGRLTCPMVLRAPFGGGIHAPRAPFGEHGRAVCAYSRAAGRRAVNAKTCLRPAACGGPRSRPRRLFWNQSGSTALSRQVVKNDGRALELDRCFVLREGHDLTMVTWGAMVQETLEAADKLHQEGVSAEVIDVATLKPIDMPTILASVEKTGRCVIVHEAARSCGVGAEIAASVASDGLLSLLAPIQRVTGYDTVMPLPRLEASYLPSVDRILAAVRQVMGFS